MSWYQKGKTNLDLTEARDSEWQWHQLGHMQVCTSLQANNHASTPPLRYNYSVIHCNTTEVTIGTTSHDEDEEAAEMRPDPQSAIVLSF